MFFLEAARKIELITKTKIVADMREGKSGANQHMLCFEHNNSVNVFPNWNAEFRFETMRQCGWRNAKLI